MIEFKTEQELEYKLISNSIKVIRMTDDEYIKVKEFLRELRSRD